MMPILCGLRNGFPNRGFPRCVVLRLIQRSLVKILYLLKVASLRNFHLNLCLPILIWQNEKRTFLRRFTPSKYSISSYSLPSVIVALYNLYQGMEIAASWAQHDWIWWIMNLEMAHFHSLSMDPKTFGQVYLTTSCKSHHQKIQSRLWHLCIFLIREEVPIQKWFQVPKHSGLKAYLTKSTPILGTKKSKLCLSYISESLHDAILCLPFHQ